MTLLFSHVFEQFLHCLAVIQFINLKRFKLYFVLPQFILNLLKLCILCSTIYKDWVLIKLLCQYPCI
jgi:hypothetical protein